MAKFHGYIGFSEQHEKRPGVWSGNIVEREYFGEVPSASFNNSASTESTNDNLRLNNKVSIISDNYAIENFQFMKYVTYMGIKWEITSIDVQYPRLILTIGGVYNAGQTKPT